LEEYSISNQSLPLSSGIHWVGVNDTQTPSFENLWNIPEGVSYNSYLIEGSEKTALIDCVSEKKAQEHFSKISQLTDISKLDYLVINHMEQDHTGAIPELLKQAPNIKLVYTPIARSIFSKFYQMDPPCSHSQG
jgi:flavorubredoxin